MPIVGAIRLIPLSLVEILQVIYYYRRYSSKSGQVSRWLCDSGSSSSPIVQLGYERTVAICFDWILATVFELLLQYIILYRLLHTIIVNMDAHAYQDIRQCTTWLITAEVIDSLLDFLKKVTREEHCKKIGLTFVVLRRAGTVPVTCIVLLVRM